MPEFIQDSLWPVLLKASWQAAVIILLVLAAQYFLRRRWRPCWRHALWLLVVARLALPATIPSPVSLFNILTVPAAAAQVVDNRVTPVPDQIDPSTPDAIAGFASASSPLRAATVCLWLWAAGAIVMTAALGFNHFRLHRSVTRRRPLIDESVLNLLEDCKQRMGVRTPITVVETATVDGPCLFGVLRPRLLLPPGFTRGFSRDELRYVFLHELGHVKRNDIPLGWLMAWLQILHWFNPLVWLAFSRMRLDRELACDALALSHAEAEENKPYGRTMVKLLENFGDTFRAPGLAGIVEDKQQMKERITMIAKFHKSTGGFALAATLLAGLGLVTLTDAQTAPKADAPPHIISSTPKMGAINVDPALKEITITFDRDMEAGMSWTGSGPELPKSPEGSKAQWRDKRTCVLPVQLQPGHGYRVGINSKSYQNFRGENGVSVNPTAVSFRTSGTAVKPKTPEVVTLNPANGATDVSPTLKELRVTFNVPMGLGFSWCGGGPNYPDNPDGKKPFWTDGGKTCVMPVALKPNWEYTLGLNSPSFHNFQNEDGVPLKPVTYTFKTGANP